MNWANRLTLGRLVLTVLFVLSLSSNWSYARTIALVLFALAGISDYFDGEIARRYGIVTKFGKLMDPLVDKVMMAAAFICLVPLGARPGRWRQSWWREIFSLPDCGCSLPRRAWSCRRRNSEATRPRGKSRPSFFSFSFAAHELRLAGPDAVWWANAWRYGGEHPS